MGMLTGSGKENVKDEVSPRLEEIRWWICRSEKIPLSG